jgi:hypothetical protein
LIDTVFNLFKFKDRIGAIHSPHFFPGTLFSGCVDMALHKQAFPLTGNFQFIFNLPVYFVAIFRKRLKEI